MIFNLHQLNEMALLTCDGHNRGLHCPSSFMLTHCAPAQSPGPGMTRFKNHSFRYSIVLFRWSHKSEIPAVGEATPTIRRNHPSDVQNTDVFPSVIIYHRIYSSPPQPLNHLQLPSADFQQLVVQSGESQISILGEGDPPFWIPLLARTKADYENSLTASGPYSEVVAIVRYYIFCIHQVIFSYTIRDSVC